MSNCVTYPPLNTLKPVARDVWIVDGPMIRFGMPWPKMPFSTRMTIVRLNHRRLFIHSPTPLTENLRAEIAELGEVSYIVGPNRIHYWWIPDWHRAFPKAGIWLASRIEEQRGNKFDFRTAELTEESGYPWDDEIRTLPVAGGFMTEVEFFHGASRSLILTDLIENFEPRKLRWHWRWLAKMGGAVHPNGGMPRDMRHTFSKQRTQLKTAVQKMIAWQPERIIIAHGRCYERHGADELTRAFRWLLQDTH